MLDTQSYRHALRMCNTHCFYTGKWLHKNASILRYIHVACNLYSGSQLSVLGKSAATRKPKWEISDVMLLTFDKQAAVIGAL
jgi:hypothetical protein